MFSLSSINKNNIQDLYNAALAKAPTIIVDGKEIPNPYLQTNQANTNTSSPAPTQANTNVSSLTSTTNKTILWVSVGVLLVILLVVIILKNN